MRTKRASVRLSALLAAFLLVPAGASAAGKLAFAPASLNFGANALGEVKMLSATLKNTTAVNIALGAASLVDNPGGYIIASTTCGTTLGAGQSCKYTLRYTAKTLHPAAAWLELTTQSPIFPLLKLPLLANLYPALNDTGVTRCSNLDANGLTCPVTDFPEQDAQYGRDKSRNVASNGKAGFSYTKIDSRGKPLPVSAKSWDCVRDNVTGLVWEKKPVADGKKGNQGLHDADDSYAWCSTDSSNNGGESGCPYNSYYNTEAYVNRVNAVGWCGARDWRLPSIVELLGLLDLSVGFPIIDESYFPDQTYSSEIWSSTPVASMSESGVWYVHLHWGSLPTVNRARYFMRYVRLVRGSQ